MPLLPTAAGYSARLHRRPAFAVNSPAILCHRCYNFRDEDASGGAGADRTVRRDRTATLNQILRKIQAIGRPEGDKTRIQVFREEDQPDVTHSGEDPLLERVGRQETILASLHLLDQKSPDWSGWRARMRVDIHVEYFSITFILDRSNLETSLQRSPENPPTGSDAAKDYVSYWYRKIWNDKFFKRLADEGIALDFPADSKFFECRGLVLDTHPTPPDPKPSRYPILDERVFTTKRSAARAALDDWVKDNSQLMRHVLRLDRSKGKDQDANGVLCYVMDGRGTFASSMGRSEAELRSQDSRGASEAAMPERYLLLHHGLPRFQVGRILRRLHVLDELRCAAAFDFADLVKSSRLIQETGDEIDAEIRGRTEGLSRTSLKKIHRSLNALTANQRIGGLQYRVNRSRYYARNFKIGMEDLRFARIKGWEPYDTFMHRSLFLTIDYIDSIGQRFEALSSRIERLTEERDVKESINTQTRIADVQEIGEIIGWTAFAYYGGQILDKFLPAGPKSCALCEIDWINLCHPLHEHWGTAIAIPVAIYAYRHFRNQRIGRQDKEEA